LLLPRKWPGPFFFFNAPAKYQQSGTTAHARAMAGRGPPQKLFFKYVPSHDDVHRDEYVPLMGIDWPTTHHPEPYGATGGQWEFREALARARTGDVLLFNGHSRISRMITTLTGTPYSHVGMVVRINADANETREWMWPPKKTDETHDAYVQRVTARIGESENFESLFVLHSIDYTHLPSLTNPRTEYSTGVQLTPMWALLYAYVGEVFLRRILPPYPWELDGGKQTARRSDRTYSAEQVALPVPFAYGVERVIAMALNDITNDAGAGALRDELRLMPRTLKTLALAASLRSYETVMARFAFTLFPQLQRIFFPTVHENGYDGMFCSELLAIVMHSFGLLNSQCAEERYLPYAYAVYGDDAQTRVFGRAGVYEDALIHIKSARKKKKK